MSNSFHLSEGWAVHDNYDGDEDYNNKDNQEYNRKDNHNNNQKDNHKDNNEYNHKGYERSDCKEHKDDHKDDNTKKNLILLYNFS